MALEKSTTIGYHQFLMEESHIGDEEGRGGGEKLPWNWTTVGNETFEEPYEGPEWIVVPLVFGLIFVVGVVGNGTLIFTVLVNKNMRTTPNVLLVSPWSVLTTEALVKLLVPTSSRVSHSSIVTKANMLPTQSSDR